MTDRSTPPHVPSGDALSLAGLSKRFGDVVAVDDVSFDVARGEVFGFCGRNGAGKTTTMRMALGLLVADRGSSTVLGRPLDADVVRRVGYMPAERGVYARMLVRDQLRYFAELHGATRSESDAMVVRWARRLDVEHHLDHVIDTLSTGNKQRVQLATALVHDPELLVLDEPFAGLDPVATAIMSEVLRDVAATGVGVLFSSHQLELVERIAHRIGIIDDAEMIAVGRLDELRAATDRRYRVTYADESDAEAGRVELAAGGVDVIDAFGAVLDLDVARDEDSARVLDIARTAGRVADFRSLERSLEQLYIDLVGHSATNGAEP